MRLAGKVALITGGTSGIGRATSLLFTREGAKVAVSGRNEDRGREVVNEITAAGGEAVFIRTDVRFEDECRRTVEKTVDAFGRIDILFNNAGIEGVVAQIEDYPTDVYEQVMAVNVRGVFLGIKHAVPHLVARGGGAIVTLEEYEAARRRGARIYGEVLGFAATSDGFDLVLPEPEGLQAGACIQAAIADAGIEATQIDYVNTHGTSTIHGDVAEVKAMRQVFGDDVPPFSSTKSMTGHGIGAAGGLEMIFCLGMMDQGFLAPSINIETPDPCIDGLDVVTEARDIRPTTIVSNNFGFGGTNATMVLRRVDG